jgi:hypothetical protein
MACSSRARKKNGHDSWQCLHNDTLALCNAELNAHRNCILKRGWCFCLSLRCQQSSKLVSCYIFSVYKILNKNTFKILLSSISVKITFCLKVNWSFWNKTTTKFLFHCFNCSLCLSSLSLGARIVPNAQKSIAAPSCTTHLNWCSEYKVLHIVGEVKWGISKCQNTIYSSNDC